MAWETFVRPRRGNAPSAVSLTRAGIILVNKKASVLLNANGERMHVELLYDSDVLRIGLRVSAEDSPNSRLMRPLKTESYCVAGLGFFNHYGIDFSDTRRLPAWLNSDGILCVDLAPNLNLDSPCHEEKAKP